MKSLQAIAGFCGFSHSGRQCVRTCFLLMVFFGGILGDCRIASAAGGDISWQSGWTRAGQQETRAAVVDSVGNAILAGADGAVNSDYFVVKIKGDGSGVAWSAIQDQNGGLDIATAVAVDSQDHVIVSGYGHNGANYDIHTIKYHRDGDGAGNPLILWEHTYAGLITGNDFATKLTVDSVDSIYVAGYTQAANGKDDLVVIKYGPSGPNPDGTPIWVACYADPANGHDRALDIAVGPSGVAVTGESQNATPDFDMITVKFASDGTFEWSKRDARTGNDQGRAVAFDNSGNVVATGYLANGSYRDLYTVKYPAVDGPEIWSAVYDNGYDDEAYDLIVDNHDHVFVAGRSFSMTTAFDMVTIRYDGGSGNEDWAETYNSTNGDNDVALSLYINDQGEVFVAGYDDNAATGIDDFMVLKYREATGGLLWARTYDGAGKDDRALNLGMQPNGMLLVTGWSDRWTSGATDYDAYVVAFDPGSLNAPTDLVAETLSNSEIRLGWIDNANNETGFVLERKTGANGNYAEVATLAAETVSYTDSGLSPNTWYFYRIKSYNDILGDSPYSTEAEGLTVDTYTGTPDWMIQLDGADHGDDEPSAIAVGPDQHPVVTGSSFSFDGAFDYLTVKINALTSAQTWEARYDDPDFESDFATAITIDSVNRVTVTGFASLYGGGGGNTNDIFTVGYPSAGPPSSWTDQYNGPSGSDDRSSAVATAVDASNNMAVVGYGKNALWNDDIYVLKYDQNGNRLWAATPYDGGGADYPSAVAFNADNDLYVAGYTHNGSDKDFFVAKYAGATGAMLWGGPKIFDGPGHGNDYVEALAVDSKGDLYVTGYAVNAGGNGDFWTIKYSKADGSVLWSKSFNGIANGYDHAKAVEIDPYNDDVVVSGTSFVGTGDHDVHLIRYDQGGTVVWERSHKSPASDDAVVAMDIDSNGAVCLTGATSTGAGSEDILTLKYDYAGFVIGSSVYRGSAGGDDVPVDVAISSSGDAYVAASTLTTNGDADYLVFRAEGSSLRMPVNFNGSQQYTQAALSWSYLTAAQNGYNLERKVGACSDTGSWVEVTDPAAGAVGYTDSGLNTATTYCYRLRTYRDNGQVSRWVETELSTNAPSPPSALVANATNTTTISLGWVDNTVNEDNFILERCTGSGCDFSVYDTFTLPLNTDASGNYVDNQVCQSTAYRYRLKAIRNSDWTTAYSNQAAAATALVGAPATLTGTRLTEASVRINWLDNTTDETGFKVERCVGASCSDFVEIASLGANVTSYTNSNLSPATTYRYRVKAYKTATCGWETDYADPVTVVTDILAPGSPTAVDNNTTSIKVSWVDQTSTETAYRAERCTGSGASCDEDAEFTTSLGSLAANTTSVDDNSVCSDTSYTYRVRAERTTAPTWTSAWTAVSRATAAPLAPTTLTAVRASEMSINLTWSDPNADRSGFELERCEDVGCIDFVLIGTPNATATSYADSGLNPGSFYRYRLRAVKNASCPWSAPYSAIAEASTTLVIPEGFNANAFGTTTVKLIWTDVLAEEAYRLERCEGSGTACDEDAEFVWGIDLAQGATGYVDETLCNGSGYTYRLRGEHPSAPAWNSLWAIDTATTTAADQAPANLTLIGVSEMEIEVAWDDVYADENQYLVERCEGDAAACPVDTGSFNLIATNPSSMAGALLSYRMEETWSGVAGDVVDSSGNGNNGTPLGGVNTVDTPSISGRSASLGYPRYIDTPVHIDQSTTSVGVTFSAWVKTTTNDANYKFLFSTDDGNYDWSVFLRNNQWSFMNGSGYIYTTVLADFVDWQHVVVVFQPGVGVTLYKNGDQATYHSATITTEASDTTVTIGRRGTYTSSSYYFTGYVDDAEVFNRPLNAAEVLQLYQIQNADRHLDTSVVPGGTYTYRVSALRDASCGWTSPYAVATFTAPAPLPPSALNGTAVNTTQINLTWQDNTDNESRFRLERCAGSGTACDEDAEFALVSEPLANALSANDTDVAAGATYTYRIRAERTAAPLWQSAWSLPKVITIPLPGAPSLLNASRVSEVEISMTWKDNSSDETGFKVERCAGAGCSDFAQIGTVGAGVISYTDSGLIPDTTYLYRVRAYKTAANSWNSAYSNTSQQVTTLLAPGTLAVSEKTTTSVGLTWIDNMVTETAYVVQRCPGSGTACDEDAEFINISGNLTATSTSYQDLLAAAGNTYTYRVRGEKTVVPAWFSPWSSLVAATDAPVLPAAFVVASVSEEQISLQWTYGSTDRSGFRLYRCLEGPSTCTVDGDYSQVADWSPAGSAITYADSGLSSGKTYHYRVSAYKTAANSWESGYASLSATTIPPAPPSLFVATAVDTTMISLSWTDNTTSESSYNVERCQGSGVDCDEDAEFTALAATVANITTLLDASVCRDTTYTYRLRGEKSSAPNWETVWVASAPVSTPAVVTPGALAASRVNESQLLITWQDLTADESGFRLERCEGASCSNFAELVVKAADQASHNDTTVLPGKTYRYRVQAIKTAGCGWNSDFSNEAEVVATINPPGNLTATASNTTVMTLNWLDQTATETGFRFERCVGAGTDCDTDGEFSLLDVSAANSVSRTDATVCEGTTYNYRMRAEGSTGGGWVSSWAGPVESSTPGIGPPALVVVPFSDTSIQLNWTPSTSDQSSFRIERCVGDGCSNFATLANVAGNVTSYLDNALPASSSYGYRVIALKSADCIWTTDPSTVVYARTLPLPGTGLSAAAQTSMSVRLQWVDNGEDEDGYEIQIQVLGNFIPLATVAQNETSYLDVDAQPETTYTYRVRPFRAGYYSGFSNQVSATTPAYASGDGGCP